MQRADGGQGVVRAGGYARWIVIAWVFVIAAVSYLDRNNISIAISSIQKEFGLSNVQLGTVFSAFVFGYALTQPFAGRLADRFGPYKLIAFAILWWSLLTVSVTFVPAGLPISFGLLLGVRLLLGVGEAVIFPASNRLVASWIPQRERGFANGLIFAGVGVGGGLAPPLITYFMLTTHSWRTSFYVCAAIGVAVGVVWLLLVRDQPRDHAWVSDAEASYIEAGLPVHTSDGGLRRWRDMILDGQVALLTASYFCYGYVAYIFFTWFFKYLSDVRGLNLKSSALYATLPFIAMAVASSLGGFVSDILIPRYGHRVARCGLAGVSMLLAAGFVWWATQVTDARVAALVLAGGAGALYLAQSAFWAISADIGGASAGAVSGVMNMGSQIGGVVTASMTPLVAARFGWTPSFAFAAAVCAVGGVLWLFIDPSHALVVRGRPAAAAA
ncbi:MAG TPA: MFS transporter [Phenylobacterium sp.]|jgi:ACS family glucarate transporter-like MFS transporter|nr:MFS transporter [Phenylobacterium sp.]